MSGTSRAPASAGEMMGHPKGLFLLFGTELWERFSYYTMRALLVLYLVDKVRAEGGFGLGWDNPTALQLYGIFTGAVYITPLIGGWLADNFLGQRRAIIIGGFLMAAGQFMIATPHPWIEGMELAFFYAGLVLLVAGNGLFKPNISTMVGDLYPQGDHRRDGAFTIFYMGINIGAALAGIAAAAVVAAFDGNRQVGFFCAGLGMVLSLAIQMIWAKKLLGEIGVEPGAKRSKRENAAQNAGREPLTKQERDRIKVIMIMGLFTVVFWVGFEQAGGLMTLYTENFTDRTIGSFEVPTELFQSLNPIFIVIFAPIIAALWIKMGDKEPNSPVKFGCGLFLLALGFVFMIGASMQIDGGDAKASMLWIVAAYLCHTLGELCLSPIGLSMVTKLAPLRLASLMMGVWFFFNAVSNYTAAFVGSLIGHGDEAQQMENAFAIFGGITITAVISGIILMLVSNRLIDWMHGAEGPAQHEETFQEALVEELETRPDAT
ncbi:peptide MFS transporter [Porticoccaceae bacterium LTM1]|nr:peptide MFS transporter [Porticoccaceae bacterium LTM1]